MQHELPQGFVKDVVGYCDPLSVLPGENIGFKLSAYNEAVGAVPEAQIVRLISGDTRPHGTGLIETPLCELQATPLKHQPLVQGSCGLVEAAHMQQLDADLVGGLELLFYPTLITPQRQTLISWGSFNVAINDQGVYVGGSQTELILDAPLRERRWYVLKVKLADEGQATLVERPVGVAETTKIYQTTGQLLGALEVAADFYLACREPGKQHFNGRIEAPCIKDRHDEVLVAWDFSFAQQTQAFGANQEDLFCGVFLQNPTRCVKSSAWDGSAQSPADDPSHYAAVHFHEDDLTDAQWQDTLHWLVPDDLASGMYALKVMVGASEDYVPFFVRAHAANRRNLAFLVPTASYLAYANQRLGFSEGAFGSARLREANSAFLYAHEEVGFSMYEYHRDHSGVHYSSRLRPIINMKPKNTTWAFNADTHLTAWLDATDQDFDVLTDEDLHREGAAALEGYRVVMTGTHPEYYSTQMWDGLQNWMSAGGRLMYMGGNGFYWRVAFQPDNPAIMEVRRAEDGTRAWIAEPGEYYQQFDGKYGGLWRRQGRPPNILVGIGFAAQGFDGGTYYRVQPGALNPRVDFIMAGVTETDALGDYGNQGGGAAGEEIDRFDADLGSPAHALVLASSEGHKPGMLRVKEEFHMMEMPGDDPKVRADMVFFELPGGGAVFSTGSISYAGALAHNDYDNDIARITRNVLLRFLDVEPFQMPIEEHS